MKLQERIKEYKEHAEKLINDELKTATEEIKYEWNYKKSMWIVD